MNGKLFTETDRQGLIAFIQKLDLNKLYKYSISKHVRRRTVSQNRLERLWLACISEDTGDDPNTLHDIFKEMFLQPKKVTTFGVTKEVYTTKDLDTVQFSVFLERIQAKAADYGINLPNPDDLIWDSFYEHYKDRL